jgi:hypothetical protein
MTIEYFVKNDMTLNFFLKIFNNILYIIITREIITN